MKKMNPDLNFLLLDATVTVGWSQRKPRGSWWTVKAIDLDGTPLPTPKGKWKTKDGLLGSKALHKVVDDATPTNPADGMVAVRITMGVS